MLFPFVVVTIVFIVKLRDGNGIIDNENTIEIPRIITIIFAFDCRYSFEIFLVSLLLSTKAL